MKSKAINFLCVAFLAAIMIIGFSCGSVAQVQETVQQFQDTVQHVQPQASDYVETILGFDFHCKPFLVCNWKPILAILAFILVIILRIIPTGKNYDILSLILRIINWILPNRTKGGGYYSNDTPGIIKKVEGRRILKRKHDTN